MSVTVLAMVLVAATGHAAWNLLTRRLRGNLTALWLGGIVATVLITPVAAWRWFQGVDPWATTPAALVCVILTGVIHAGYFFLLSRAYTHGEISLVYPVARGSGIGLTAIVAHVLLGESISMIGVLGMVAISVGIASLAVPALVAGRAHGLGLALGVGVTIPLYSIVDKVGTHLVPAVIYIWAMYLLTSLILAPLILRHSRAHVAEIWRRWPWQICGIGVGSMLTYLLILYAFQLGQVSYIVAARESSVVFGATAGIVWLGEHWNRWKLIGVGAISSGLVCLALA